MLGNIFNVKCYFVIKFSICHVYNKVEETRILLNTLSYTSLGSLFHLKEEAVFERHEVTLFSKRKYTGSHSDKRQCVYGCIILFNI